MTAGAQMPSLEQLKALASMSVVERMLLSQGKLTYTLSETAKLLGISRDTLKKFEGEGPGQLKISVMGKRPVVTANAIASFVRQLDKSESEE